MNLTMFTSKTNPEPFLRMVCLHPLQDVPRMAHRAIGTLTLMRPINGMIGTGKEIKTAVPTRVGSNKGYILRPAIQLID